MQKRFGLFPGMHVRGERAYIVGADDYDWDSSVALDIELHREQTLRIFLNTDVHLLSPAGDYRPRFVTYELEPGITFDCGEGSLALFFHHYSRYDVNAIDGSTEQGNLIGIRRGTAGMKAGRKNEGIDFTSSKKFELLKKVDWEIAAGKYVQTNDYDYGWNAEAALRWDVLRHSKKVFYLGADFDFLWGGDLDTEYYVETGVRFHDVGDITFFWRFQHREDVDLFGGYDEDYFLFGTRIEF